MLINENIEIRNTNKKLKDIPFNDVYSTSETLTNKIWIDGKPIYRKCFSGTTSNTGNNQFEITNLDKLISHGGYVMRSGTYQFPISSGFGGQASNDVRLIKNSNGNLNLQTGQASELYNKSYILWVEYTKTTD